MTIVKIFPMKLLIINNNKINKTTSQTINLIICNNGAKVRCPLCLKNPKIFLIKSSKENKWRIVTKFQNKNRIKKKDFGEIQNHFKIIKTMSRPPQIKNKNNHRKEYLENIKIQIQSQVN